MPTYLCAMNNEKALNWLYNNHPDFSWDMVDFSIENKPGVYCIYDTAQGLSYFGKSSKVRNRINMHKSAFLRGGHYNPYMQKSYNNGSEFKYFCVKYTAHVDTAGFLEAHFACVFGPEKLHNRLPMSCSSLWRGSPTEYWQIHELLGYEYDKSEMYITTAWFSRDGEIRPHMKNAIEYARKLII